MKVHLEEIRRRIAEIDYICSGTLLRRTKVCGKPGCACARDPRARHGPYYEWSRREKGRQVVTVIPVALAPSFHRAIRNYRRVLRLLRLWERESVRAMTDAIHRYS
jgi:hypothetical protein